MYFLFVYGFMFAYNWPGKGDASTRRMVKVTHQGVEPGAKCDICDCLMQAALLLLQGSL